jgi:hypothetical protein
LPPKLPGAPQPNASTIYLPLVFTYHEPSQPAWLSYLNNLRSLGNLPALSETAEWSSGCALHSRYMVKNDVIEHDESPSNPWYTPEGQAAAQNSDLFISSNVNEADASAIDSWIAGSFHGVGILDPKLTRTGFGSYREAIGAWRMGACLDVLRGVGNYSGAYPVQWPKDGSSMNYLSYGGFEMPGPLTSCPGFSAPGGPPIFFVDRQRQPDPQRNGAFLPARHNPARALRLRRDKLFQPEQFLPKPGKKRAGRPRCHCDDAQSPPCQGSQLHRVHHHQRADLHLELHGRLDCPPPASRARVFDPLKKKLCQIDRLRKKTALVGAIRSNLPAEPARPKRARRGAPA